MSISQLHDMISDIGEDAVRDACLQIVASLQKLPSDQIKHIPMPTILEYSHSKDIDVAMRAAEYLSRGDVAILTLYFELVDDEDQHYRIDLQDYCEARANDGLTHPKKGVILTDFEEKLFPFYSAKLV